MEGIAEMKEARDLINYLHENAGQIPARDMWQGIEALQAYAEELELLADNLPPVDLSVTVQVDKAPQGIKFANVDKMAEWLAERMNA